MQNPAMLVAVKVVIVTVVLVLVFACVSLVVHPALPSSRATTPDNAVTVLLPTYSRNVDTVRRIVRTYEAMPLVAEVVLIEFDTGHHVPHSGRTERYANDLRFRFSPRVDTPFVLVTDDDGIVARHVLDALVTACSRDPETFHGVEGRAFARDKAYDESITQSIGRGASDRVDMVITSCLVAASDQLARAFERFATEFWDLAYPLNGEDIAINMINGSSRRWNWGYVTLLGTPIGYFDPGFQRIQTEEDKKAALSMRREHAKQRTHVKNNFLRLRT